MGGGVGGTPQGAPFIFFPKPVVSEGKERENPRWITVRLRDSFTTHGFRKHYESQLKLFLRDVTDSIY